MKAVLPLAAAIMGVVLVSLSLVWGLVFSAANNWTPDKAKHMSELNKEVHNLSFKVVAIEERPSLLGGQNPAEVKAKYHEKKAELAIVKAEFDNIKESPNTIAKYFRWTGIGLVLLGALAMKVLGEG